MGVVSGQVALVTGAGRGLGAGIALALAKQGALLAVSSPQLDDLDGIVTSIRSTGGEVDAYACDVTVRSQVDEYVAQAVKRFGSVDILVNNAALTEYQQGPLEELTAQEVRDHVEIDVVGSLNCMQACFPHMKERGGSMINFSSTAATEGVRNHNAYAIAKEAIRGLTKVAANEWGKYAIAVNAICPAGRTPGYDYWLTQQPPGTEDAVNASIAMGHMGDPETDIGQAVVALASPLTRFITGRTIFVDGGQGKFM